MWNAGTVLRYSFITSNLIMASLITFSSWIDRTHYKSNFAMHNITLDSSLFSSKNPPKFSLRHRHQQTQLSKDSNHYSTTGILQTVRETPEYYQYPPKMYLTSERAMEEERRMENVRREENCGKMVGATQLNITYQMSHNHLTP